MSRPTITTQQLQEMAREHISYEIEMFEYAGGRLFKGGLNTAENNVMLETFLLHARCLIDFLYPDKNPRKDDVLADDFFPDPAVLRSAIPPSLSIDTFLKQRTGKEVAHLTYARLDVTPEMKPWQVGQVHDQIGEAMAIFFECLTDEQRHWFRTTIKR